MSTATATASRPAELSVLVRSDTVKESFGGISDMTLWRWIQHRGFPKPTKMHGRNYWNPRDVEDWRHAVAE